MKYRRITEAEITDLWELQKAYKAEIREDCPTDADRGRLTDAIRDGKIMFYGAWDGAVLAGCCSVTIGFSTFNYAECGTFEDFYIVPRYRHQGIARELVQLARTDSGVSSLTVGCADCDKTMYTALGFTVQLGNLLAYD